MDEVTKFIDGRRAPLLRYLDRKAPAKRGEPDARQFVQSVIDEWMAAFASRKLPEACLAERTFWFALYQLEELGNLNGREFADPYERLMLDNLDRVRELLRSGSELPAQFYATRPGEMIDAEDLSDIL